MAKTIRNDHFVEKKANVKHLTTISNFDVADMKRVKKTKEKFFGIDIESDVETGEPMLLGIFDGNKYQKEDQDLFDVFAKLLKMKRTMFAWSRFDAQQIFRLFYDQEDSFIEDDMPVIERNGTIYKIEQEIGHNVKISVKESWMGRPKFVFIIDVSPFFDTDLKGTAKELGFEYSKIAKEYHIVDWEKYFVDEQYKEGVIQANFNDARAVYKIADSIFEDFYKVFDFYPSNIFSSGSKAKSGIIAHAINKLGLKDAEEEIKNIGILSKMDHELFPDVISFSTSAYSGGMIGAPRVGYAQDGYYSDIKTAYGHEISKLKDLKDCKIEKGRGEPPKDADYVQINGTVNVPRGIVVHPITIKSVIDNKSSVRPTGTFKAGYTYNEREHSKTLGITFSNEEWVAYYTTGKKSILADLADALIIKKENAKTENERRASKDVINSLYGLLFEAIQKGKKKGLSAGIFFNSVYAAEITANVRVAMSKLANDIEKQGGNVICLMTDSITYTSKNKIESELFGDIHGMFEEPKKVSDIMSVGSGRFSFVEDGKKVSKTSGFENVGRTDWIDIVKRSNDFQAKIKVNALITDKVAKTQNKRSYKDIGKIVETEMNYDLMVGSSKREYPHDIKNAKDLLKGLYLSPNFHYFENYMPGIDMVDGTLNGLKRQVKKQPKTQKTPKKPSTSNKDNKKRKREYIYNELVKNGIDPSVARKARDSYKKAKELLPTLTHLNV